MVANDSELLPFDCIDYMYGCADCEKVSRWRTIASYYLLIENSLKLIVSILKNIDYSENVFRILARATRNYCQ